MHVILLQQCPATCLLQGLARQSLTTFLSWCLAGSVGCPLWCVPQWSRSVLWCLPQTSQIGLARKSLEIQASRQKAPPSSRCRTLQSSGGRDPSLRMQLDLMKLAASPSYRHRGARPYVSTKRGARIRGVLHQARQDPRSVCKIGTHDVLHRKTTSALLFGSVATSENLNLTSLCSQQQGVEYVSHLLIDSPSPMGLMLQQKTWAHLSSWSRSSFHIAETSPGYQALPLSVSPQLRRHLSDQPSTLYGLPTSALECAMWKRSFSERPLGLRLSG